MAAMRQAYVKQLSCKAIHKHSITPGRASGVHVTKTRGSILVERIAGWEFYFQFRYDALEVMWFFILFQ